MKLSTAAKWLNTQPAVNDIEFSTVSIDTRSLQPNDLFVAIKGPNFDGHDFIDEATKKGACAVITERPVVTSLPQLQVANTTQALGSLAQHYRTEFAIPVIGITGSCGKTSTRALLTSILSLHASTLCSERSFNNHIGVPLTLLRINPAHHFAVIEMGTNHFGEIAYLTQLAEPTVALITNAAAAHLEGLTSVEGVAQAKGEIFQGLSPQGTAILNGDDPYFTYWQTLIQPTQRILHFSLEKPADIYAQNISITAGKPCFTLITPYGETPIALPLLGRHNVANALAAATAAYALDIPLSTIKKGLEQTGAVSKRLNIHLLRNGIQVIDDSYNANPLSVQAAIATLAEQDGNTCLVLGDMKELGSEAWRYHTEAGQLAKVKGIDQLYTYGELSQAASAAFGITAKHFNDQTALITCLQSSLTAPATVLIKGSYSMRMDKVAQALLDIT